MNIFSLQNLAAARLAAANDISSAAASAAEEMGVNNPIALAAIRGFAAGVGTYVPLLPIAALAILPFPGARTVAAATVLALDIATLPEMAEMAVEELRAVRASAPAPAAVN